MFKIKKGKEEKKMVKTLSYRLTSAVERGSSKSRLFSENGATHIPDFYAYKDISVKLYKEEIESAKQQRIEVNLYVTSNADAVHAVAGLSTLVDTVRILNHEKQEPKEIFFNIYYLIGEKTYKTVMSL